MEKFLGSWKCDRVENLEEYMTALGFNEEIKAVFHVVTLRLNISQEDDTVTLDFSAAFLSNKYSFKLGEDFQLKTTDGRDCKVVVYLEGDKIIDVFKWDDTESTTTYEINDGQLIRTLTYQDAMAVFTFKKA